MVNTDKNKSEEIFEEMQKKLESQEEGELLVPIGVGTNNKIHFYDLGELSNILIGGTILSGKSRFLHSIILSLALNHSKEDLKLILVDPKRVQYAIYENLPHLLMPIIYDLETAVNTLFFLYEEAKRRQNILNKKQVRTIREYNLENKRNKIPEIVFIVDEFSEFHLFEMEEIVRNVSNNGKDTGIHLIFCTQRPSPVVYSDSIKSSFKTKIAFKTASMEDSKTILGVGGAEKLRGHGDMLFLEPQEKKLQELQAPLVDENYILKYVDKCEG